MGVVTSARITHATPAAAYAHTPDRTWETDLDAPQVDQGCKDIARQLIEDNPDIAVRSWSLRHCKQRLVLEHVTLACSRNEAKIVPGLYNAVKL